jgi:hypothetical protein
MTGDKDNIGPPFSMRFTKAERATLDGEAGPLPLSDYIRRCLFAAPDARKRAYRRPVRDDAALSRVLEALGRSRLPQNLNQLAKAAHSGSLPLTPETEQALQAACSDVAQMRQWLMAALGHLPKAAPPQAGADRPEDGGPP